MSKLKRLIVEAHRRSLWQVLGIYVVASWVIYQVVVALWEGIGLPSWVPGTALVLLLIGLPIVLATAFVQEGAPGLGRAEGRDTLEGLESTAQTVSPTRSEADGGPVDAAAGAAGPGAADAGRGRSEAGERDRRPDRFFTWNRAITGGVLAFAALGLAATGFMGMRALGIGPAATLVSTGAMEKQGRVVLADTRSADGDTSLADVVTEALRADLAQSDVMEIASRNEVASALQRMERPTDDRLTAAVAREVAIRGGMKAVIAAEIGEVAGSFVLTAEITGAQEGDGLASFRETAVDSTDLIPAMDRLSKSIREKVGESLRSIRQSPYLMAITTPSLAALQKLVQAFDAENEGDSGRALALLDDAIDLDPEFAAAYRKKGAILVNQGRTAQAVEAISRALENPDRLSDYERYHAQALHAFVTGDFAGAVAAYRTLIELDEGDAAALNNLDLVYGELGEYENGARALERAVELNLKAAEAGAPVFGPTFAALANRRLALGDRPGADSALALLASVDSQHPALAFTRAEHAVIDGEYDRAAGLLRDLLGRSGGEPLTAVWAHVGLAGLSALQGRVRAATDRIEREIRLYEQMGDSAAALRAAAHAALQQATVTGDSAAALATLTDAVQRYPLDSIAAENVPYVELATAYARAGRTGEARELLDRMRTRPASWFGRRYAHAEPAIEAAIAFAEGRYTDAAAGFERAHQGIRSCRGCFLVPMGLGLEMAGRADSALATYTRYLELDWGSRLYSFPYYSDGDSMYRGLVLERLADLHEQRGEVTEAIRYNRELVDLWADADPELQPRVEAARRALGRLVREGG